MSSPPPVSICLTTYNRASVLPGTVDSLLAQSFCDFELIINDDFSSDETEAICRDYQSNDSRVKYFKNTENLKMPGNLNAAIQRATGDYIANVHDGDVYGPVLIEKWKEALDAVPSAGFVFNGYEVVNHDGSRSLARQPYRGPCVPGAEIALHFFRTFTSCVWGTVMARGSAYQRSGLFDARFGFISDVDMWLRLAKDHDVAYVNEPLITITPREPDHPYAFVHWRHDFWTFGIYNKHLSWYSSSLPEEVRRFRRTYPRRRLQFLSYHLLLCLRHRRWDRLTEGLAICRDADGPLLRMLGRTFGRAANAPEWYSPDYWDMARLRA